MFTSEGGSASGTETECRKGFLGYLVKNSTLHHVLFVHPYCQIREEQEVLRYEGVRFCVTSSASASGHGSRISHGHQETRELFQSAHVSEENT